MMLNQRCSCGRNCISLTSKKDFVGNLYKCSGCGFILLNNNDPHFELTDLRSYQLRWSDGFHEVTHKLYQLDLLRIMKAIEQCNGYYFGKLKNVIQFVDKFQHESTDFNRRLPKVNLKEVLDES
jgi:hypothetical protein